MYMILEEAKSLGWYWKEMYSLLPWHLCTQCLLNYLYVLFVSFFFILHSVICPAVLTLAHANEANTMSLSSPVHSYTLSASLFFCSTVYICILNTRRKTLEQYLFSPWSEINWPITYDIKLHVKLMNPKYIR